MAGLAINLRPLAGWCHFKVAITTPLFGFNGQYHTPLDPRSDPISKRLIDMSGGVSQTRAYVAYIRGLALVTNNGHCLSFVENK